MSGIEYNSIRSGLKQPPCSIEALAFANLLTGNTAEQQAADIHATLKAARELSGSDRVAIFACELRTDTLQLLHEQGFRGNPYLQQYTEGTGQSFITPPEVSPPYIDHVLLATNAWRHWQRLPAALSVGRVVFGGSPVTLAGTHLTHLTSNPVAQTVEAKHFVQEIAARDVDLVVADTNRGNLLQEGASLASAKVATYVANGSLGLRIAHAIARRVEQPYTAHLHSKLVHAGYYISDVTKQHATWHPRIENDEGWLDNLASTHNISSTTDHAIMRQPQNFAVTLLQDVIWHSDHIPFVVTQKKRSTI